MRIAQVIRSDSWGEISPAAFDRGIGGREGALVRLAKEWAFLGHEVTSFVQTNRSQRFSEREFAGRDFGFHEYIPLSLAQPMLASFPYDAVVAWECPSIYDLDEVMEKQKVRLVHMQVAHLDEMDQAIRCSTGVVSLSPWARDFLIHSGLGDGINHYVRPNGVNMADYPLTPRFRNATKARKDFSIVYSSSPDRGLWHLLSMWPMIRKEYKKAKLFVAYGVDKYTSQIRWSHSRIGQMSVDIEQLMKQEGVIDVGKIGQPDLAKLQLKASAWLYPCDSIQATETGCITAIENMAAGNVCVMSDADCLPSEFGKVAAISPLPFNPDDYMRLLDASMFHINYEQIVQEGREFAENRNWSKIAPTWIDLFKENEHAQA